MTLRSDTTRLCDAMDMLVKDNIKLREFINKKNNDMGKVLNTLAEEEGEIVSSLKDNISVIEEENQHLLYKVEQLEELLERERDLTRGLEQGMQGGKQMSKRIAEDLNEVRLRDKASTEKLMIMST
jgi:exonuclease VII large subunit